MIPDHVLRFALGALSMSTLVRFVTVGVDAEVRVVRVKVREGARYTAAEIPWSYIRPDIPADQGKQFTQTLDPKIDPMPLPQVRSECPHGLSPQDCADCNKPLSKETFLAQLKYRHTVPDPDPSKGPCRCLYGVAPPIIEGEAWECSCGRVRRV